ncbi:MAG: ribosome biogenesis GTPase Der [Planctomycetota bacterium]
MKVPTIAIVGRPNVGKSSYLNAAARRRVAIVEPTPGVTRDRLVIDVEMEGRKVRLMDTGGIGIVDEARLDEDIAFQIDMALELADAVIFLIDGKEGVTPLDRQVAERLRRLEKPLMLGVNKIDHPNQEPRAYEAWELGLGEPMPISAQEGFRVFALLGDLLDRIPPEVGEEERPEDGLLRLAIVGKRNVGKSTFLNTLAGKQRVIVSDIAGTTRDAVDVELEYEGRRFVAIDTAGIMKKSKVGTSVDFYSQTRTEAAIRRADVVLFLFDAVTEVSQVDKKIAMQIIDEGKACVLVANKWDLAEGNMGTEDYLEYLQKRLPGLHFAPLVFMSARQEFNTRGVIDVAFDLHEQASLQAGTGELNRAVKEAFERRKPGGRFGYKARIFYATQVRTSPPTFAVFVNSPDHFPDDYRRYLENRLREAFGFSEVPVHVRFRGRTSIYHD